MTTTVGCQLGSPNSFVSLLTSVQSHHDSLADSPCTISSFQVYHSEAKISKIYLLFIVQSGIFISVNLTSVHFRRDLLPSVLNRICSASSRSPWQFQSRALGSEGVFGEVRSEPFACDRRLKLYSWFLLMLFYIFYFVISRKVSNVCRVIWNGLREHSLWMFSRLQIRSRTSYTTFPSIVMWYSYI